MPAYRVVFKNGEKHEFVCSCVKVRILNHVVEFYDDAGQIIALIPESNVLYVKKTTS